jgi:transcriptional regulator with XRE-family HTH domain
MTQSSLGRYLLTRRTEVGMSRRHLGRLSGVDQSYIARLEKGEMQHPSTKILAKLIKALGIEDASHLWASIGVAPEQALPPARVYFMRKYGLSGSEAAEVARLVEDYTNANLTHPQGGEYARRTDNPHRSG